MTLADTAVAAAPSARVAAKRALDVAGAFVLLLLLLPVLAVAAAWVWSHDRGPIVFTQTRLGRDGRPFTCLKLRTMAVDAEAALLALAVRARPVDGLFKLADDPRLTGPGRSLRRMSIDEIPQLVNVIRGDMSLVGPRPILPSEVGLYGEAFPLRQSVRPGLTGLWQVSGRSDLSLEDSVRLDVRYATRWSLGMDVWVLAKTIPAVLTRRGAY